jgi:putative transposase
MSTARYRTNAGAVVTLKAHLVWCPKYRRPVLTGSVADRLRELLTAKAAELDATIEALEVLPDHVHLCISYPPIHAVAHLVNQFKGDSSRVLRQEFPALRSRLPALWSRSYYAGAVGHVSAASVRRYIDAQQGR